jgi:hypothetical protein
LIIHVTTPVQKSLPFNGHVALKLRVRDAVAAAGCAGGYLQLLLQSKHGRARGDRQYIPGQMSHFASRIRISSKQLTVLRPCCAPSRRQGSARPGMTTPFRPATNDYGKHAPSSKESEHLASPRPERESLSKAPPPPLSLEEAAGGRASSQYVFCR